jgi:hypothetical protein
MIHEKDLKCAGAVARLGDGDLAVGALFCQPHFCSANHSKPWSSALRRTMWAKLRWMPPPLNASPQGHSLAVKSLIGLSPT